MPEPAPKCHICSSTEHAACGFCSCCREHAVSTYSPDEPWDSPDNEALTECCGASLLAYDYEPDYELVGDPLRWRKA